MPVRLARQGGAAKTAQAHRRTFWRTCSGRPLSYDGSMARFGREVRTYLDIGTRGANYEQPVLVPQSRQV
jgi:hypothetical protein